MKQFSEFVFTDFAQKATASLGGREFAVRLSSAAWRIETKTELTVWTETRFPAVESAVPAMLWSGYCTWREREKPVVETVVEAVVVKKIRSAGSQRVIARMLVGAMERGRQYHHTELPALIPNRKPSGAYFAITWMVKNGMARRVKLAVYELTCTPEEFEQM